MPPRVLVHEDAVLFAHQEETVDWGTAPSPFTPLPLLGVAQDWEILIDANPESYKSGQSYTPTGRFTRERELSMRFAYWLQDDNPTNSLLSYAVGSAPNGGTGVITNWFDTTDRDTRSFTAQVGVNRSGMEQYYRVRGAKVRRWEASFDYRRREIPVRVDCLVRYFDKQATTYGTVPSPSVLAPFDPVADKTIQIVNPAIDDVIIQECQLVVENQYYSESVQKSGTTPGDKSIGIAQPMNPRVTCRLTNLRDRETFLDAYLATRGTAAAEMDLVITLSKNSGAEFLKATLTNCEIMDTYGLRWQRDDAPFREGPLTLEAKTWAFDVLTP